MRHLAPLVLAATLALPLAACKTNPHTGRSQFLLISESEELRLGAEAFSQVTEAERVTSDAALNAPLRRVGARIAAIADQMRADEGQDPYQWEFRVIDDSESVNAWCLPGGKIGFYTGIYPVLEDEAGMAMVMGHEVCHALLRHGGERVSQGMAANVGMQIASALTKGGQYSNYTMAALGLGTQVGFLLPFSRSNETEADKLGLMLAARAGYDPRAAVRVWENMARESQGSRPPQLLSTHPDPLNRIANMEKWMPEALQLYERSQKQQNYKLPPIPKSPPKAKQQQPGASNLAPQQQPPRRRRPKRNR